MKEALQLISKNWEFFKGYWYGILIGFLLGAFVAFAIFGRATGLLPLIK